MTIQALNEKQQCFFETGKTRSVRFRMQALDALRKAIVANQQKIYNALLADLGKPPAESYMTETGMVLEELRYVKRHIAKWSAVKHVKTPLAQFPARSFIMKEPYGRVLIMAPWNYPFQLCMAPLVGAIAAGNCAIVKPSAYAPHVSQVVADIIAECFPSEYIAAIQGGREENTALLAEKFDYIFFTGSVNVGKTVMAAAAKYLTPVTLELGGKSPVIVDKTADIALTAKRIVFGKFLNAGQTCVAPDYLLVQKQVQQALLEAIKQEIAIAFPRTGKDADRPGKIINEMHFNRLQALLSQSADFVYCGGECDADALRMYPCVVQNQDFNSPLMQEEIFGPILPVIPFDCLNEIIPEITGRPKPLALYLFTKDKLTEKRILHSISFGGGCVNDTIVHLASTYLGFGGVGESGMGSYHGKNSFETFSHTKSILKKSCRIDLPLRYRPYTEKKLTVIQKFMK